MNALDHPSLQERIQQLSPEQRRRLLQQIGTVPEPETDALRSVPLQEHFWLLANASPEPLALHTLTVLEVDGVLNYVILRRSFNHVMAANEIYRWRYSDDGGDMAIARAELGELPVEIISPTDQPPRATMNDALREAARKPFNLATDPLIRLYWLESHGVTSLGLVVHHLCSDGPSLTNFLRQLRNSYDALRRGEAMPTTPENAQYSAYARRENKRLTQPYLDSLRQYWEQQLAGAERRLELPRDRASEDGSCEHYLDFPFALQQKVEALAALTQRTPYAITLSVFFALLHRYTGQEDLCVGAPVSIRPHTDDELVQGCTMNMICLRQIVAPRQSFNELAALTADLVREGLNHGDYPYTRLVDPSGSGQLSGQFEAYFQYRAFRQPIGDMGGHATYRYSAPAVATNLPLAVEIHPSATQPSISVKVDPRRFSKAFAERLGRRYLRLLSAALSAPNEPICALPLMDELELADWRQATQPPPSPYPVTDLPSALRCGVDAWSKSPALHWSGTVWTYAELWREVGVVAGALHARGVSQGDRVGLFLRRDASLLFALLGVLRSGAAYVPLDPDYPEERLKYIANDGQLAALIVNESVDFLGADGCQQLLVDELLHEDESIAPNIEIKPDDLAYLIYTSGSTGQPKGVAVEHRSVVNFLHSMAREPGFGAESRLLALTTISFDISVLELFLPLLCGGQVILGSEAMQRDPKAIAETLDSLDITHFQATPSSWRMLLDSGWPGAPGLVALCGGEPMGDALAKELAPRCRELWNLYGPTETTVWSSVQRIEPSAKVTIGQPIANTQIFVLDSAMQPMPAGLIGELWIGGDGLARGYWQRLELTAERFQEVLVAGESRRLYRTGDLGFWNDAGELECLGRVDGQVKIRGHRIELDEIERAVQQLPVLERAVVVAHCEGGRTELVVYFPGSSNVRATEWIQTLAQRLPGYMTPVYWEPMAELPRTPAGKIDRKHLSGLPLPAPAPRSDLAKSANEMESALLDVWSEVFPGVQIGCTDDFFMLGGDSLLAVRLLAKINERCGVSVAYRTLYESRTIQGLAEAMSTAAANAADNQYLVSVREGGAKSLVLVHGMMGGVGHYAPLVERLNPEMAVYGLVDPVIYGEAGAHESMEALAEVYARTLINSVIKPPYRLLGYSLGGYIAFAVASRLQKLGEPVEQLYLVEAIPANLPWRIQLPASLNFRLSKMARVLRQRLQPPKPAKPSVLGSRAAPHRLRLITPPAREHYSKLREGYQPKPAPIPTTLFRSRHNRMCLALAWRYLAQGNCRVVTLDAHHNELLDPDLPRPLYAELNKNRR